MQSTVVLSPRRKMERQWRRSNEMRISQNPDIYHCHHAGTFAETRKEMRVREMRILPKPNSKSPLQKYH